MSWHQTGEYTLRESRGSISRWGQVQRGKTYPPPSTPTPAGTCLPLIPREGSKGWGEAQEQLRRQAEPPRSLGSILKEGSQAGDWPDLVSF